MQDWRGVESSSHLTKIVVELSWRYPGDEFFTQCSFYVFLSRRILSEDRTRQRDKEKEEQQVDRLEGLRVQGPREL